MLQGKRRGVDMRDRKKRTKKPPPPSGCLGTVTPVKFRQAFFPLRWKKKNKDYDTTMMALMFRRHLWCRTMDQPTLTCLGVRKTSPSLWSWRWWDTWRWFSHQQCSILLPTCEIDHGGQRRVLGWVGTGLALIKRAVWGGQFGHAQYAMSWTKLLRFQFRGEERKITKKLHNLKVIFKLNETLFNNGTLRNLTVFSA